MISQAFCFFFPPQEEGFERRTCLFVAAITLYELLKCPGVAEKTDNDCLVAPSTG